MTMSGIVKQAFMIIVGTIRQIIDNVLDKFLAFVYKGKQKTLPPIQDPCLLESAFALAQKIRTKQMKSVTVVKAFIERIQEIQPLVNGIVDERFAEAIKEAELSDNLVASGEKSVEDLAREMPLLGVPVTIKEAIAVKGLSFTVGLPSRKGVCAKEDSDIVILLKQAGAIPIAVTMTSELCFWWESYNMIYGRSNNPYDTTRTVGGSSGGEGCVIGAAGSVIGIGNDMGGSIRIPAFFNGIFGHKPSRGMVSNKGQYPPAPSLFQTYLMAGPLCRYAEDLLPLMKIISGNNHNLEFNHPVDFTKIKIYYMEDDGGCPLVSPVNPEIALSLRRVLDYFSEAYGITARRINFDFMQHSFEIWVKLLTGSDMFPVQIEMTGRNGEANLFMEWLRWIVGQCEHILPVLVSAVLSKIYKVSEKKEGKDALFYHMCSELQQQFEEILKEDSVFLYPTNPDLAPHHYHALVKPFNIGYTAIFNLFGFPVSQCPLGISKTGLPLGIQVIGGHQMDYLTISFAEELERAFGGWVSPSPINVEY